MAQVAMMTVLHGIPTFRGEGEFVAWVDRVVVRSAISYAKSRRMQVRKLHDAFTEPLPEEPTRPDAVLDRRRIVALLDRLPMEQRQAVVMHHMMQLTVPEIADELAVPAETVRTRLRTGLARLRALLRAQP